MKKTAREILGDTIQKDGSLYCLGGYIGWTIGDDEIVLDGRFTIAELVAIVEHIKKPMLNVEDKHFIKMGNEPPKVLKLYREASK